MRDYQHYNCYGGEHELNDDSNPLALVPHHDHGDGHDQLDDLDVPYPHPNVLQLLQMNFLLQMRRHVLVEGLPVLVQRAERLLQLVLHFIDEDEQPLLQG